MQRRHLLLAAAALPARSAFAHHGWSSFDTGRPLYLSGRARKVAWRNPHAEFDLELDADLKLPADLAKRPVPAQSAGIDGARLFASAQLPTRKARLWHVELAPLTRMGAWNVTELRDGDAVAMVGYTFAGEKGEPVLRVEYLLVGTATYGLRSSPA
ncbi:MAG TPA: DUF6152 family protein [Piscinibacter sp.]|jgi:hypothetical protein|nr:DUF6152 family protein [Piscinibacter sp.]HPM66566.1 DUF6152 family protein [Piscinibacter sp.]